MSEPFCGDCNRVRLTADGRLRTCLFSLNETDLRGPMRDGADDGELEQIIRDAVWRKELKHHVGEPGLHPARPQHVGHRRLSAPTPERSEDSVRTGAVNCLARLRHHLGRRCSS